MFRVRHPEGCEPGVFYLYLQDHLQAVPSPSTFIFPYQCLLELVSPRSPHHAEKEYLHVCYP